MYVSIYINYIIYIYKLYIYIYPNYIYIQCFVVDPGKADAEEIIARVDDLAQAIQFAMEAMVLPWP